MGRIRIYDGTRLADYESTQWDGEVVIDLAESRDSPTDAALPDSLATAADAVSSDADQSVTPPRGDGLQLTPEARLRAVAGSTLTLVGLVIGLTAGIDVFTPGSTAFERTLTVGLLAPYYVVCTSGTLWILDDAARVAASDASWRPNPWPYVVGGGAVVAAGLGWIMGGTALFDPAFVPVTAGVVIASSPLAGIVAGPIYLAVRSRRLD